MEHIGLTGMLVLWALVGITVGWMYATRADYRDPAEVALAYEGSHRRIDVPAEPTVRVLRSRVVARHPVPVHNRASLALTGAMEGSWTTTHSTLIRRHASDKQGQVWDTDGKGILMGIGSWHT